MRACWLKWVGRDWSISADYIWLNYSDANRDRIGALRVTDKLPSIYVTNSLSAFSLLEAREDCELCLVGGMYRRRTAAFVGPMAEDALRALGIDTAFIGANGILDGDVSTSNMDEGRIQQLAFSKADTRYLIADSSKIGRRYFCPPLPAQGYRFKMTRK